MNLNFLRTINYQEIGHKVRYYLTRNHYSTLLIHLGLMLLILALLIYIFFYIYLPATTNHDITVRVPKLHKMKIEEVDKFLADRDLRYEVADTSYDPGYPPLSVLKQNPKPNSAVKINRKIYITINAANPPKTRIPQVIDFPYNSAITQLKNVKLKIGKKEYVPSPLRNVVLKVAANGTEYTKKDLEKGVYIPQGSAVDLYIATGNRDNSFAMPNLIGRLGEDAKIELEGNGLSVEIHEQKVEGKEVGTVISQKPAYGRKVIAGETVELWVVAAND